MSRNQRVMVQPINVIFKHLQSGSRVSIWLYDNTYQRIEGKIVGFDEFMNIVMSESEEVWVKDFKGKTAGTRNTLGQILLKGDNITLIQAADVPQKA
ncbi:putative small nuclear ribonucleoprotein E [Meredithblackwellia eburnea MCA 4105]